MADMEVPSSPEARAGPKYKELTDQQRMKVFHWLSGKSQDWELYHGAIAEVAAEYGVARSTIWRLWQNAMKARVDGLRMSPAVLSKKKARGRKPIYEKDKISQHVRDVPLNNRKTMRGLAAGLGVSLTTVFRWTHDKEPSLKMHGSAIKPTLTEDNKVQRALFALEHRGAHGKYLDMYDRVHVDEHQCAGSLFP
jgi:hypothetical protein